MAEKHETHAAGSPALAAMSILVMPDSYRTAIDETPAAVAWTRSDNGSDGARARRCPGMTMVR